MQFEVWARRPLERVRTEARGEREEREEEDEDDGDDDEEGKEEKQNGMWKDGFLIRWVANLLLIYISVVG